MRITDLTLPIENTWNWNANLRLVTSHAEGDPWQMTGYDLVSHMYTHIDFPIHHTPDGVTSDAYPLEKYAITKCLMLDLTAIGPNGGIDAKMLEEALKYNKVVSILDTGEEEDLSDLKFVEILNDIPLPATKLEILIKVLRKRIVEYGKTNAISAKKTIWLSVISKDISNTHYI